MPLYDLWPVIGRAYISPSASIIGEVKICHMVSIHDNVVIRGDINAVTILDQSVVHPNTVIHTAASLPTGTSAEVMIGTGCIIGPKCTLYSCTLDDDVIVGAGTVILEGARLESGCMVAPGSVIPPGRLIPSKQLWAGNPVRYVRNLLENDELNLADMHALEVVNAEKYLSQFEEFGHAHMYDS
jgi:carbonic anhydrase/acetyltransferase-like protein (isoleucine patch superfamily)